MVIKGRDTDFQKSDCVMYVIKYTRVLFTS